MFWGLIMEPNKRYTQTVQKSFHVSMASLDHTTADDQIVQVMLCCDGRNYLLCSLKKNSSMQVPLDLNFEEGTKIAFTCNGHGHVHLTGYMISDDEFNLGELEEEEEEDEQIPQLVDKQSKRKATKTLKNDKNVKRLKQNVKEQESSDDDDLELDDEYDEDGDVSLQNENEEDDSEEDEEDDDDDDDEEEEDEEEEVKTVKPQQQENKKSSQQQQPRKKEEKNKLVNGKESKPEQQNKQQKKNKVDQQQQQQQQQQNELQKRVVEGGVQIQELKVGTGIPAKAGKFISVYYVGRLKNGKKFDATTHGDGFKFRLGKGEVIKGWDVGIAGMKVGGKRRITIPPAMGYGAKGSSPVIPGNSTLVFEVELRNVY